VDDSDLALLQSALTFVQPRLMLIGPRLTRVSPSFSLIGTALPLVSKVFSIVRSSLCGLRFSSHGASLAGYPCRDLGSVVEIKLFPDPLQVALYGALGDEKTSGNRSIGQAFSDQTRDLPLSRGQPRLERTHPNGGMMR
jgi:hypothetical protein